jgi:hypothetical protein
MRIVRRLLLVLSAVAVVGSAPAVAHPPVSSSDYRWVDPPSSRASDNLAPEGRRATLPAHSAIQAFWTPDLQLTMEWSKDGLGAAEATIDVQPLDPATLAALPGTRRPNGNAYRIELLPAGRFSEPARLVLAVPYGGTAAVFHSVDGRAWTRLPSIDTEDGAAGAAMVADGYVLASIDADVAGGGGRGPTLLAAALVLAAVAQAAHLVRRGRLRRGPRMG